MVQATFPVEEDLAIAVWRPGDALHDKIELLGSDMLVLGIRALRGNKRTTNRGSTPFLFPASQALARACATN